jgi:hypothetical protein
MTPEIHEHLDAMRAGFEKIKAGAAELGQQHGLGRLRETMTGVSGALDLAVHLIEELQREDDCWRKPPK